MLMLKIIFKIKKYYFNIFLNEKTLYKITAITPFPSNVAHGINLMLKNPCEFQIIPRGELVEI